MDTRPTIDAPDDDPYLWLEEVDGEEAIAWVDKQNERTLEAFSGTQFETDRDALLAIYDAVDKIPYVHRRGEYLYNFWKDAENPRGLWRRTTMEEFQKETPPWDVLLDIDALAKEEDEDWIWAGSSTLPVTHDIAMLRLSRGGGDAVVLREFNLESRTFVADGFYLPESKGGVDWLDRDTLLVNSPLGDGMATTSGYARTVRLWSRGEDFTTTKTIFEIDASHMAAGTSIDRSAEEELIWYVDAIEFFDRAYWIGDRNGPAQKIEVPSHVTLTGDGSWVAARPREVWTLNDVTYAPDTVVAFRLSDFLAGTAKIHVLFEPEERRVCRYFIWANGKLILPILDNLQTRYEVLTPSDDVWHRATVSSLPTIGVVDAGRFDVEDTESNGDLLVNMQSPLAPSSLALLTEADLRDNKPPTILKTAPAHFNADGLVVTQHEAISIDGERIPYTQVGPAETDGNAPVHMSGYGGFGLPRLANYNASIGKTWLEHGGISVTAHIRGGGEFGTPWHEAGRGAGKALTHDDFAAVAADLVARGITRPDRIAAEGGSNGGILISNMLTRYPERFGALFCTIPLIDMRRYTKLLAGASWIAEYGDPDNPEDWEHLKTYSAYHAAEPGKIYPPILLATARRDDRVHPGHARKMAEKLQSMGYDAWFYEPAAGGHGYGKDNAEQAAFVALGYNFLRQKIGWET